MPRLFILCGLAFSGKSTGARRVAATLDAALVSFDALHAARGLDPGADLSLENWVETERLARAEVEAHLRAGRDVVADNTFSYRTERDRFRALAESCRASAQVLFFDTPWAVIEARMARNHVDPRRGHVTPEVAAYIRREFEPPAPEENAVRFVAEADVELWLKNCLPSSPHPPPSS